jgi:hypothetical protein
LYHSRYEENNLLQVVQEYEYKELIPVSKKNMKYSLGLHFSLENNLKVVTSKKNMFNSY